MWERSIITVSVFASLDYLCCLYKEQGGFFLAGHDKVLVWDLPESISFFLERRQVA